MIIGEDFVWLHFPKCAGTAVELALRTLLADRPGVRFDPIEPSNVIWHHTIAEREWYDPSFSLGKRRVICCFRQLPTWVLSRVHFEAARGPDHRTVTRKMLMKGVIYERDGKLSNADVYAEKYSSPRVDRWVRAEHLAEDLSAAFALDPDAVQKALIRKNAGRIDYLKPLSFWFTKRELSNLYDASPTWTRIEKEVYGSLLAAPQRKGFLKKLFRSRPRFRLHR